MRDRLQHYWFALQQTAHRDFDFALAPTNRLFALWAGRVGLALSPPNRTVTDPTPNLDPLAALKSEPPGPDGIRHGLVSRVRQMIAEGAYDTPARWAEAEEQLLARVGDSR